MLNYIREEWRTLLNFALFFITLFFFFYLLKLSFLYAAPVYFALLFYMIYRPIIKFFTKRGLNYRISAFIGISSITVLLVAVFISLGTLLYIQTGNIIKELPGWTNKVEDMALEYNDLLKTKIDSVPTPVTENAINQVDSLTNNVGDWSLGLLTTIYENFSVVGKITLQIVLGYILSIFLAFEWQTLKKFYSKTMPSKVKKFILNVFGDTMSGISSYVKTQIILITFTFIVVWISLTFFGVQNALFLAFLSGVFDLLPLLGISTLFIPWIIYLFIVGNSALAIKLTVLWLIIICVRQVMEPRLTGNSLGISPFVMLAGMTILVTMLGFIGIILAPVVLVIIKSLWEKNYFHTWLLQREATKIIIPKKDKTVE